MLLQEHSGKHALQGRHRTGSLWSTSGNLPGSRSRSRGVHVAAARVAGGAGWAPGLVRVIDEDLGRSAASAKDCPGFRRLVTEVTMGQAGLLLDIEMSRLAWADREWRPRCNTDRRTYWLRWMRTRHRSRAIRWAT